MFAPVVLCVACSLQSDPQRGARLHTHNRWKQMVDELTPTRGVDSDHFSGYSLVYVSVSVYALSITVIAHISSVSARSPLVLRANFHRTHRTHRTHPQVLRVSRLDVHRRPRPIRPAGTIPQLTPLPPAYHQSLMLPNCSRCHLPDPPLTTRMMKPFNHPNANWNQTLSM